MRLYFIPVDMPPNGYFYRTKESHDLESVINLERIFDEFEGEWLIFDDLHAAKQYVRNADNSINNLPIYEVEAHSHLNRGERSPFKMSLDPKKLRQMTISKKDLLSVTINDYYLLLNRELFESREIERLRKYLFSFELNDRQKKAALELINCLTDLKGEHRKHICGVVDMSITYIGYRNITTKESYEIRANWYLTHPSEQFQLLGKALLGIVIVYVALTVGLFVVNSPISIPAAITVGTVGLISIGIFANSCRRHTRLSKSMHEFANKFEEQSKISDLSNS